MAGPLKDFFLAVTDNDWFQYLSSAQAPEVNFWRPSATPFRALAPGSLFLFKLHAPLHAVAGAGVFAGSVQVSVHQAWEWFGQANGAASLMDLAARISRGDVTKRITCILLTHVRFWPEREWLDPPTSFARNTQVGKGYLIEEESEFYEQVMARMRMEAAVAHEVVRLWGDIATSGSRKPQIVLPRVGQTLFRSVVTIAYGGRCAVTGEKTLPVLEAAHVRPYAKGGEHSLNNALLLRSDLHRLFDAGYATVDPEHRVFRVSSRIAREFRNGREYLRLDGKPIAPPRPGLPGPSAENLAYHAQRIFVA